MAASAADKISVDSIVEQPIIMSIMSLMEFSDLNSVFNRDYILSMLKTILLTMNKNTFGKTTTD